MMRAQTPWLLLPVLLASLLFAGAGFAEATEAKEATESAGAAETAEAAEAAEAAEEEEPVDLEKIRIDRMVKAAKFQVGSRVSRYLTAATDAADKGTPEEGLALLDKLNLKRLNPYERMMIFRLKAYMSYGVGDYEATIEYFEKVLAEEVLTLEADNKIRFNIAQIHASLEHWREAINALHRWFRYVDEPIPLAYYLLGIAHYQLGEFDLAIANTAKAVEISDEPAEGWLQLLAALYVQQEDYKSALPILERLVTDFPKKQYWVQLSLIYGARDDYRSSLAVQQVAYAQGLLTEDTELRRLARSYLFHDLPHPAAAVLEKGIADGSIKADADSYELLANSLVAARDYDRSLVPLKKAAELAKDGNLYVRLGQVHLQREEWSEAAKYLQMAVDKGDLKNPGNAQLLLGIAYYNDRRVAQARTSFARAREHESTREAATRWISHIENEARTG